MPHIVSTDKQKATLLRSDHLEKQTQTLVDYIKQEASHAVYVDNELIDPTNDIKQLGRYMTTDEMERKLRIVLPTSVVFIQNPWLPHMKAVVRMLPKADSLFGTYETLTPYERGIIPEHSVLQRIEEEVPDTDVLTRRKSLSRKDLGKFEYVQGQGFQYDDTSIRPGFTKIKKIGRELKRGWRTVLLKLIIAKVLSISDAERLFSSDTTTSWAFHTGRKSYIDVPW